MRLGVYTDYPYRELGGAVYTERAFALFLVELGQRFDRLVLAGRLAEDAVDPRYRISGSTEFVALPYYDSLAHPLSVARAFGGSLASFWRVCGQVDAVLLLGPHPLAIAFAGLAALRRRRVFLGVRQDLPQYVRARHPGRRALGLAASALELSYRALALIFPTVTVGPAMAGRYGHARRGLELTVSLVRDDEVADAGTALAEYGRGGPAVISVGRLAPEKNPLLLADVLAELVKGEPDSRLIVCGEGPLERELGQRLSEQGLTARADLRGYVPFGDELLSAYGEADCLLLVSWTEGLPQVLVEAMAIGLPVVATDVGGIRAAVGEAAVLVPPGDAAAAAAAVRRVRDDAALRERLIRAGLEFAARHTLEHEATEVARFIAGRAGEGSGDAPGERNPTVTSP
jgi:glycosyltransferase involved in cell wall biosynthesis